jgi:hypothetical protein
MVVERAARKIVGNSKIGFYGLTVGEAGLRNVDVMGAFQIPLKVSLLPTTNIR